MNSGGRDAIPASTPRRTHCPDRSSNVSDILWPSNALLHFSAAARNSMNCPDLHRMGPSDPLGGICLPSGRTRRVRTIDGLRSAPRCSPSVQSIPHSEALYRRVRRGGNWSRRRGIEPTGYLASLACFYRILWTILQPSALRELHLHKTGCSALESNLWARRAWNSCQPFRAQSLYP